MQPPSNKRRTLIVLMLMAVMVISVLDKTIFAFAGPQIIDELKLSPEQFGFIGSVFFFSTRFLACWWAFSPTACQVAGFFPACRLSGWPPRYSPP